MSVDGGGGGGHVQNPLLLAQQPAGAPAASPDHPFLAAAAVPHIGGWLLRKRRRCM
jgi:hypothetical protein